MLQTWETAAMQGTALCKQRTWWEELSPSLSLQTGEELQQFVREPQQGCAGLLQSARISSETNSNSPP